MPDLNVNLATMKSRAKGAMTKSVTKLRLLVSKSLPADFKLALSQTLRAGLTLLLALKSLLKSAKQ